MKKIVNINLAGIMITIEHNALQRHLAYIKTLQDYFGDEEGCFEIINDIENRMAELMQVRMEKHMFCINEPEIENIISIMGTVAEIELCCT